MGKIDDNGTMRDPSSQEQSTIAKEIGGGIGQPYELLDTITVSEPTKSVTLISNINNKYDDILIEIQSIKGTNGAPLQFAVRNSKSTSGSTNMNFQATNFLNDSTSKKAYCYIERLNLTLWDIKIGSSYSNILEAPAIPTSYDNKIYVVSVGTNGDNKINEATIKIYGRNRM